MSGWRTSFRRTSFVVQTKILDCETSITHKICFWRQKLSQFVRKFVSQNKAKNVYVFWEKCGNAGNTSKCGISRTIAGWLTPMGCRIWLKSWLIELTGICVYTQPLTPKRAVLPFQSSIACLATKWIDLGRFEVPPTSNNVSSLMSSVLYSQSQCHGIPITG